MESSAWVGLDAVPPCEGMPRSRRLVAPMVRRRRPEPVRRERRRRGADRDGPCRSRRSWTRICRCRRTRIPATPVRTSMRPWTWKSSPGQRAVVPTGIAIELPDGFVGLVHPRSGLAARLGVTVLNAPGTIDAGYRGEIMVILINHDPDRYRTNFPRRPNRAACRAAGRARTLWSRRCVDRFRARRRPSRIDRWPRGACSVRVSARCRRPRPRRRNGDEENRRRPAAGEVMAGAGISAPWFPAAG